MPERLETSVEGFEHRCADPGRETTFGRWRRPLRAEGLALLDEVDLADRPDLADRVLLALREIGAVPPHALDRIARLLLTRPPARTDGPLLTRLADRLQEVEAPPALSPFERNTLQARLAWLAEQGDRRHSK